MNMTNKRVFKKRASNLRNWADLQSAFQDAWTDEAVRVGVVIGCSGGADSVALVRLVDSIARNAPPLQVSTHSMASPPLIIAHFNHQLRGVDSDLDESHVASLAEQLGRAFVVERAERSRRSDSGPGVHDEASLRGLRRRFLVRTAKQHGCRYIALAHTADDQAETVLHNALRGTGSAGLSGMAASTPIEDDFVIRRPLLGIRRECVRQALVDLGQTWREDLSNEDSCYTRNWLRNEIMPALRERFAMVDESLIRLAENQQQTDHLLNQLGQEWFDAFVAIDGVVDQTLRIRICMGGMRARNESWPHEMGLARHHAVVTRGLQITFQRSGLPLGDMTQGHWHRLCDAVLEPASTSNSSSTSSSTSPTGDSYIAVSRRDVDRVSMGHLPGHIEISVCGDAVELSVRQGSGR